MLWFFDLRHLKIVLEKVFFLHRMNEKYYIYSK